MCRRAIAHANSTIWSKPTDENIVSQVFQLKDCACLLSQIFFQVKAILGEQEYQTLLEKSNSEVQTTKHRAQQSCEIPVFCLGGSGALKSGETLNVRLFEPRCCYWIFAMVFTLDALRSSLADIST
jgi:hypothetical protein